MFEQFEHRQNLEIAGVLQQSKENTNLIVIEVAKLFKVVMFPNHVSTSHRLPKKPNHSTDNYFSPSSLLSGSQTVTLETKRSRIENLFAT